MSNKNITYSVNNNYHEHMGIWSILLCIYMYRIQHRPVTIILSLFGMW